MEVFTGDEKKAGTDAEVYLKMYGEKLESNEFHLKESETHTNKFERNHVTSFFPVNKLNLKLKSFAGFRWTDFTWIARTWDTYLLLKFDMTTLASYPSGFWIVLR